MTGVNSQVAFPTLTREQLSRLGPYGEEQVTSEGELLFKQGDECAKFFVVLEGRVELVDASRSPPQVLVEHGAGGFIGEDSLLSGQPVLVTGRVKEAGRVLTISLERLREIIVVLPDLSDLIINAFLLRHDFLRAEAALGLRIIGSRYSRDTLRLREFALRNHLPHTWVDLDRDSGAERMLCVLGIPPEKTPIAIWQGREVCCNPSIAELAELVGLDVRHGDGELLDLVVVGAGPAGLAAAINAASEGLRVVMVEAASVGGQAGTTSKIENYLGFPSGISGSDLATRAQLQAEKFGAGIRVSAEVVGLRCEGNLYVVELFDGSELTSRGIILATGTHNRRLPVPRLEAFEGAGVYYEATDTEAALYRDQAVAIVGGGNSAGQAAVFMSERARRVCLLVRGGELARGMSRYLVSRIERTPNIEVRPHVEVVELHGEGCLTGLQVRDNRKGQACKLPARALFVFTGTEPRTDWMRGRLALDDHGFILTGPELPRALDPARGWVLGTREPQALETSLPGVFAAGDVRSGSTKRVATAVGEGAVAVLLARHYLATMAREHRAPAPVWREERMRVGT
jgi:thioredoxin reductase (NADPH)